MMYSWVIRSHDHSKVSGSEGHGERSGPDDWSFVFLRDGVIKCPFPEWCGQNDDWIIR